MMLHHIRARLRERTRPEDVRSPVHEAAGGMPRTMLRYAIERFPEPLRRAYLRGESPAAEAA